MNLRWWLEQSNPKNSVYSDSNLENQQLDSILSLLHKWQTHSNVFFLTDLALKLFFHLQEEEGFVVYENHMSSSYEVGVGPRGSITRDSHFEWACVKSISLIAFVTL